MKRLLSVMLVFVMLIISFAIVPTISASSAVSDDAITCEMGVKYGSSIGSFSSKYYTFRLTKKSHLSIIGKYECDGEYYFLKWSLFSSDGKEVWSNRDIRYGQTYNSVTGYYSIKQGRNLPAGTYYLELYHNCGYDNHEYNFTIDAEPVITLSKGSLSSLKSTKGNQLIAAFKAEKNAIGYQIQYSTNEQFKSGTKIVKSATTSKTISGLNGGKRYYVHVRPYTIYTDGTYVYGQYSMPKAVTVMCANPKISKLQNTKQGVKITWKKVSGAAKYRIYRKTSSGQWKRIADTNKITYTDKTAKSGTTYSYTLRCISSNGKSFTSSYYTAGTKIKCKR